MVEYINFTEGEVKELNDVVRLFFLREPPAIRMEDLGNQKVAIKIQDSFYEKSFQDYSVLHLAEHAARTRAIKLALYDALTLATSREMPWGGLTGVRPTKLFYELATCVNQSECESKLRELYRISDSRIKLLFEIAKAQEGCYFRDDNAYNLYVHIPFCTTKCTYCSFISFPYKSLEDCVSPYIEKLSREIKETVSFMKKAGKRLLSVYVGGGTPVCLPLREFELLLDSIDGEGKEYTLEAGRPDDITKDKLNAAMSHGVNRVCLNPQSLNDETLKFIGRKHTVADFYATYDMLRSYPFDVNCDLIAGFSNESESDFERTIEGIVKLAPANVTVHTLALKNGSKNYNTFSEGSSVAEQSVRYAYNTLKSRGYMPYYVYRQKRMAANLENIGYALPGKVSVNNVSTMEETISVVACGAGAITKIVSGGKISRFPDLRDVKLYLQNEDNFGKKLKFIEKSFTN